MRQGRSHRSIVQFCCSINLLNSQAQIKCIPPSPPCSWRNFELLRSELEDGCEGSVVGDLQHLVGQLRVGGEGDLEGDLGAATA